MKLLSKVAIVLLSVSIGIHLIFFCNGYVFTPSFAYVIAMIVVTIYYLLTGIGLVAPPSGRKFICIGLSVPILFALTLNSPLGHLTAIYINTLLIFINKHYYDSN